jgi:hypothetical protein
LKAQIHLIPAKRGLEIGFVAIALFAAELSLQNASSAIRDFREENNNTCMKYFHQEKNLQKTSSTTAYDED